MPFPENSPIQEYEQRLESSRQRALRLVYACYGVTCVPYLGTWIVAIWMSSHWWLFAALFWLAYLLGVVTGVITLWKWSLLSWGNRFFGLAPWLWFSLLAVPMAMDLLWG
jgi:hypothetical protein